MKLATSKRFLITRLDTGDPSRREIVAETGLASEAENYPRLLEALLGVPHEAVPAEEFRSEPPPVGGYGPSSPRAGGGGPRL